MGILCTSAPLRVRVSAGATAHPVDPAVPPPPGPLHRPQANAPLYAAVLYVFVVAIFSFFHGELKRRRLDRGEGCPGLPRQGVDDTVRCPPPPLPRRDGGWGSGLVA